VKPRSREHQPATVPQSSAAKPAGEVRVRWSWTEPWVWTDRMLTALEQGVKGGKWFSLIDKVDSWIRMRLRSILRRRRHGRGRGRGRDHQRWPNAFFAERGLFSLAAAYVLVRQSSFR